MSLETLRAWCERHGARIHGIRASIVQHGRGIVADRELEAGEPILAVPGRLLMSGRSARAEPDLSAAFTACPGITPVQVRLPSLRWATFPCWCHCISPYKATRQIGSGVPQALACHLLHEASKAEKSFWAPYIAVIPRPKEYHLLSCWSAAEIEQLQACSTCALHSCSTAHVAQSQSDSCPARVPAGW